ncbi:MAG: hypothetical protein KC620_13140 [Myxococcales bacterium]|nr:hypothetical protein [Myxococcales bacterium]
MRDDHGSPEQMGAAFLNELFAQMRLGAKARAGAPRDGWQVIEITGELTALRRRPDLVSALNHLTGQVVNRAAGEQTRCLIDLGGDYEARKALLETVADDVARAVKRTGRQAVLDGLPSPERRVVHARLAEVGGVATRSEGDERNRVLYITRA